MGLNKKFPLISKLRLPCHRERSFCTNQWINQTSTPVIPTGVYPHMLVAMGGAPIGAGDMTPTFRGKGDRGHNLGDNSYLTYCSYQAFTLMSTLQTYELGWLSYPSNILSPSLAKKWKPKKISARFARRICPPSFKTVAPSLLIALSCIHARLSSSPCRHELTKLFIFWPRGANPWAKVHQNRRWLATHPGLPSCQISSPCVNPRRKYPLQNILQTNKETQNDTSPACLSTCGDNN